MPRLRGLLEYPEHQVENGELHQLAVLGIPMTTFETTPSSDLASDLQDGTAIVAAQYREQLATAIDHEVYPGKVIEKSRSAHGVTFGRFLSRRPKKEASVGTLLNVAMKPFSDPIAALLEMHGYKVLQDLGIETFNPVGVFPSKNFGNYIMVSEKRNDLMSLDRDDWVVGRQVTSSRDAEIADRNTRTVKEVSATLAQMHLH